MSKYNVLLVEDDEIDVMNIQRGFKECHISNPLYVAKDGIEGLEMLTNGKVKFPILILLDINMPRMNGIELLKIIKNREDLKLYPVVVLTSSKSDKDRIEAYKLSVAGYIVKPIDFGDFTSTLAKIGAYWSISEFPSIE